MRIILVRHGETYRNRDGEGPSVLTPRGIQQAKGLAKRLKRYPIKRIYSSDLERALQTTQHIIKYHKIKPVVVKEFREIRGILVGGMDRYGSQKDLRRHKQRVEKAWNIIKKIEHDGDILIVCHGGFIRYMLSKVLEVNPKKMWPFIISNCSINVINKVEREYKPYQILLVNGVRHIPKKHLADETMYLE